MNFRNYTWGTTKTDYKCTVVKMQYRKYENAHDTRSGKYWLKDIIRLIDFFLFFSCRFRTFFLWKFDNFEVIRFCFIESFNCGEVRNICPLGPVLTKKFSYSYFVEWEIRNPFDLKVFSTFSLVCILAQERLFFNVSVIICAKRCR